MVLLLLLLLMAWCAPTTCTALPAVPMCCEFNNKTTSASSNESGMSLA